MYFFFLMIRRPPRSTRTDTLFPYTTLFRSAFASGTLAFPELLHRAFIRSGSFPVAERTASLAIPLGPDTIWAVSTFGTTSPLAMRTLTFGPSALAHGCGLGKIADSFSKVFRQRHDFAAHASHLFDLLQILALVIGDEADRNAFRSCPRCARSEEHTSELQSLMRISYAVFCL